MNVTLKVCVNELRNNHSKTAGITNNIYPNNLGTPPEETKSLTV
jgi:hypothetical protein